MISSSNFFNKSFFRSEEAEGQSQVLGLPLLKRDHLTPWGQNKPQQLQSLIRQLSDEDQDRQFRKKRREESEKISSNLLKETQKKSKLKLPLRLSLLAPQKAKAKQQQQLAIGHKLPLLTPHRKQHSERVQSMSIGEYIHEQRSQMQSEFGRDRSISPSGDSGVLNFLARRPNRGSRRLGEERKTIDIRRDLMRPMELLNRREVVNFSLQAMRRQARKGLHDKYKPIKTKDRYQI